MNLTRGVGGAERTDAFHWETIFFFFFYLLVFGVSYLVKQQVTPTCTFTCTRYRNGPPCARGAGLSIAGGAEDASRTAHVRECA